ncbi:hypothetical protein L1049_020440 [Liquidambar formosana]|uniref:Uncharacterized protein n=1 Tax=Liquidambar formosana TaxID=63359 RepID=A0AAP0S8K9_LIQFO
MVIAKTILENPVDGRDQYFWQMMTYRWCCCSFDAILEIATEMGGVGGVVPQSLKSASKGGSLVVTERSFKELFGILMLLTMVGVRSGGLMVVEVQVEGIKCRRLKMLWKGVGLVSGPIGVGPVSDPHSSGLGLDNNMAHENLFQDKERDGLVNKEKSRLVNIGPVVGCGLRYLESMKGLKPHFSCVTIEAGEGFRLILCISPKELLAIAEREGLLDRQQVT